MLLFDRGLLAFGNLIFVLALRLRSVVANLTRAVRQFPGLALLVGPQNVQAYLFRRDKLQASACARRREDTTRCGR